MYSLIYLLIRCLLSLPILLIIHCIQEALGGGLKPQVQKKNRIWNWAYNMLQETQGKFWFGLVGMLDLRMLQAMLCPKGVQGALHGEGLSFASGLTDLSQSTA